MTTPTSKAEYRQYLPDLTTERFQRGKSQTPYEYAKYFADYQAPPWLYQLTEYWKELYAEPFKGITSDGTYLAPAGKPSVDKIS